MLLPRWRTVIACLLLIATAARAENIRLEVYDLRCDSGENPLGVDSAPPRLSWKLRSDERGQRETAWQILVSSSLEELAKDQGTAWDSGQQSGDNQLYVPYAGRALKSSEQLFWKVRVWGRDEKLSAWSAPASWTMGVLPEPGPRSSPDASVPNWQARWITDPALLPWVRAKIGFHSQETTDEKEPKWVSVDLGEPRLITAVRLHSVYQVIEEGQGFPRQFKIEASDHADFSNATVIADFTQQEFPFTTKAVPNFPVAGAGVTARYVRVVTSRLKHDGETCCLALSQFEVVSDGHNVAARAPVSASDSLETGRWSAASLTDGLDLPGANPRDNGTLLARREFTVKPALRRALVHVSGLGHYELSVNGHTVGEDLLSPGWTTYEKTDLYDTRDVTALVQSGGNAIGLLLGGGMYNVRPGRYIKFESLFRPLMAICQLRLEYTDGHVDFVGTDAQWKLHPGPITFSNMYGGEDFDARLVPPGWNQPAFDDAKWTNAVVSIGPGGTLRGFSYAAPPLRAHETLKPVAINPLGPGAMVYDLGQNVSLMPRLRVRGPPGAVVRIIPSELLKSDGTLDRASSGGPRGAEAYWSYTLDGSGNEEWFPRFFYHGCRYLEVELTAPSGQPLPEILSLEGVVVNSDSAPAGDFACSNELFNRIRTLVRWSQRSNTVSVLTDCPHRERLGWQEQYHLNGPALRYEYDLTQLYSKTFGDMADAQQPNGLLTDTAPEYVIFSDGFRDSPEWGSALILAAWQHWQWTGDDLPLRRHYDAMRRYVDYLSSRADGHLISFGLGDWYDLGPKKPGRSQLTPIALTASAFYYIDTTTLASIAVHLGETNDSIHYGTQAAAIRTAFNHAFFNDVTGSYATGSQCANALPLVAGLVAPEHADAVLAALVSDVHAHGDSLTAGDVGYRYLLRALADGGRSDVIFAMNNQSEKPGYGYQLAHGCTSLAEAWNAEPASSQDHFMLGQITEWFYHDLAGLGAEAESPGFKRVVIRPRPVPGVTWARATHESPRGPILSSWKIADHKLTLEVAVPPNATATVYIPAADPEKVREGEKKARKSPGVRWLRNEAGCAVFAVESGHFVFTAPAAIQPEPGIGGTR